MDTLTAGELRRNHPEAVARVQRADAAGRHRVNVKKNTALKSQQSSYYELSEPPLKEEHTRVTECAKSACFLGNRNFSCTHSKVGENCCGNFEE